MQSLPKVSIITVCFNAEKYIERTIKSVITQTYPNIEYLVIDGQSKDRTVEIIRQYRDKINYFLSERDKNHFDAMNKGLRAATGDYVWYMNAGDCIYAPDTLEKAMREGSGKDFIYGEAVIADEAGNTRKWHKKTPPPEKLSPRSFINGMVICHHSMIIKRSLVPEYDLHWKIAGDTEWAIRVLKNVRSCHYLNIPFCLYLEGGISADNRLKSVMERFHFSRKHFGLLPTLIEQVKIGFQIIQRGRIS
ncbi:MAG TPA: glycosyltransferase family 2 protein [Chitinophagales bacterium]|nr:glycosyltransferase family 2 protein [Chitinophagales bacterium]